MSESHEKYKDYKNKQEKANRYKTPERKLEAEIARREYETSKREEEQDYERSSKLLDWGSMD